MFFNSLKIRILYLIFILRKNGMRFCEEWKVIVRRMQCVLRKIEKQVKIFCAICVGLCPR